MADAGKKAQQAFAYYSRLARVRDFVQRSYAEDITLRRAARVAGLEQKYFSSYFRSKTGICFSHWLAQVRVEHAIELMRSQDHSITEIAYAVGFRDLRTFERAFKRHTGQTPLSFKKSVAPL